MRQLAIIRNVGIGTRDVGRPCLWFDTYVEEGIGALQIIDWDRAAQILQASGICDVRDLNGKPCWVDRDGNTMHFAELWKDL